MLARFAGLQLRIPTGWGDITTELPPGSPPTLARGAGIGAVQFSVARYQRGTKPDIGYDELRSLFIDFCQTHTLGQIEPSVLPTENPKILCVGGAATVSGEFVAVWYLSNGIDAALVTYTSLKPESQITREEAAEARAMVQSTDFDRE